MSRPDAGRWWRRGRDQATADAREAAGMAAQTLIGLDRWQTQLAADVAVLPDLAGTVPPSVARQVQSAWEPVQAEANEALAAYMDAVGSIDLQGDPDEAVARRATELFRASGHRMAASVVTMQDFGQRHAQPLQQARNTLATLPARVQEARVAVTAAQRAVARAREAGFAALEAGESLARIENDVAAMEGGGATRTMERAAAVTALAQRLQADVAGLPQRRTELTQRVASVRTFLQVTEGHLAAVPDLLSELRRGFVHPSMADLDDVQATAAAALDRARDQLARAETVLRGPDQRYGEAATVLAAAREQIDTAAKAAQAPAHRLGALQAVAADPEQPLQEARRVLRDAQRFAAAGDRPGPQILSRLEALSRQLETVTTRLEARNRPDYWAYLRELQDVGDAARRVVQQIRDVRSV